MHAQIFEVDENNKDVYKSEKLLISARVVAAKCDAQYRSILDHRMVILLMLYSVGADELYTCGMILTREHRSTRRKMLSHCHSFSQQTQHKLVWDETDISMVKDRRLSV